MEETNDMIISTINVNKLYTKIKTMTKYNTVITHSNIIDICILLMKTVEKYNNVNGKQKKELVISVITQFIKDTVHTQDNQSLLNMVDITLPILIDTIIGLDKSEIKIAVKKTLKSCFPCCGK